MADIHETIRKLMALGCPAIEGIEYGPWEPLGSGNVWLVQVNAGDLYPIDNVEIVKSIWCAHAAEWAVREKGVEVTRAPFVAHGSRGAWWHITAGDSMEPVWRGFDLLAGLVEVLEEDGDGKDT